MIPNSASPLPAPPRLTVPLEVYYFDTDAGGVVHNIAYLRMIEIARSQLAAALGWSLADMESSTFARCRLCRRDARDHWLWADRSGGCKARSRF